MSSGVMASIEVHQSSARPTGAEEEVGGHHGVALAGEAFGEPQDLGGEPESLVDEHDAAAIGLGGHGDEVGEGQFGHGASLAQPAGRPGSR